MEEATLVDRIVAAVRSFGGEARMTRPDHATGTDRVGEVAAALNLADDDLVLNVQGDEPEVRASALDRLIEHMQVAAAGARLESRTSQRATRGGSWRDAADSELLKTSPRAI